MSVSGAGVGVGVGVGAGFELPSKKVSWLKRDVLLFNISIGCTADELHYLYEGHPKFAAFPTLPLALAFKGDSQEVIDFYTAQTTTSIPGCPKLDPVRLVDGQRLIRFLKPVPTTSAGRRFELREQVLGVYDKGKAGTVVETEQRLVDRDTNQTYTQIVGSLFYVGQGGWGGPRGPKAVELSPPRHRNPDGSLVIPVSALAAHLYRLNGDYNPLHATPEPGRLMGYGGIIVHGVTGYQMVAHALLKELGGADPANIREFQAKFAGPVRPGDHLTVEYWRMGRDDEGWEEIRFLASTLADQKIRLSNGRALLKTQDGKGAMVKAQAGIGKGPTSRL
ncbi:hypothetical protein A1O3_04753 [Capronia epimyces CBS 606.96]|uniref:Uncharacterized protein n=1 Tax=Capronia epimyces CBS 606.96 TaxID=1182542 RepID=W9Y4D3_9EURO|nr:uncharacterized protein A1O3_04753 [Capronia epimyces CBS 606.96]EXJ84086.1 hypothetical protein A1O3_04753 [Capronia epimyces CBS 606.96]